MMENNICNLEDYAEDLDSLSEKAMEIKLYNWDYLCENAMGKPFNSKELNAKDNARAYFEEMFDLSDDESVEESIDCLVEKMKEEPLFDPYGNFVCMYDTKGNKWRYE